MVSTRPAAVSGFFYPADPGEQCFQALSRLVFLGDAVDDLRQLASENGLGSSQADGFRGRHRLSFEVSRPPGHDFVQQDTGRHGQAGDDIRFQGFPVPELTEPLRQLERVQHLAERVDEKVAEVIRRESTDAEVRRAVSWWV